MNADKYDRQVANRLLESAHPPNPHEACEAALDFVALQAYYYMGRADRYEKRSRALTVIVLALAWALAAVVAARWL